MTYGDELAHHRLPALSRRLLLLASCLIVYGSFYPFSFKALTPSPEAWQSLLDFSLWRSGIPDAVANIVLFVPYGFLYRHGYRHLHGRKALLLSCLASGTVLAALIQFGQLWAAQRVAWGGDVGFNVIGCLVGYVLATRELRADPHLESDRWRMGIPFMLGASLILIKLAPFAPSIDLGDLKANLKAVLLHPRIDLYWVFENYVLWLVPYCLLAKQRDYRQGKMLLGITAAVLGTKFIVVSSGINLDQLLGAGLALTTWWLFSARIRAVHLALLLALMIVGNGLYPFEVRSMPIGFQWLPFEGGLVGNTLVNIFALTKKCLLYTTLIFLMNTLTQRPALSTVLVSIFLLMNEQAQRFVTNSVPEITDALLALVIGATLHTLRVARSEGGVKRHTARDSSLAPASADEAQTARVASDPQLHESLPAARRIPALDGLRAIAALAVFIVHFQQKTAIGGVFGPIDTERLMVNGNTGVALFFVLSGFLLSLPFWERLRERQSVALGPYLRARIARIVPAYYLCLLGLVVLKALTGSSVGFNNIVSHLFFLHNLKDYQVMSLNPPFWTLAVEMQFYLALPLLFVLLARVPVRAALPISALLIALCYGAYATLRQQLLGYDDWPVVIPLLWPFGIEIRSSSGMALTYSMLGHFHIFLLGVVAAGIATRQGRVHRSSSRASDFWVLSAALLLFVTLGTELDDYLQVPFGRYNFPYVPLLLGLLIYHAPTSAMGRLALDRGLMRWLGNISYGVYLYHFPVLTAVGRVMDAVGMPAQGNATVFGALSLLATLILAHFSFVLFERPVRAWMSGRGVRLAQSRGSSIPASSAKAAAPGEAVQGTTASSAPPPQLSATRFFSGRMATAGISAVLIFLGALAAWQLTSDKRHLQQAPWAGRGTDLIFDHHTHTKFSDGALYIPDLSRLAYENGCDAFAITDHSDRRASLTPEKFRDIERARLDYPEMLIFAGMEVGLPSYEGREHMSVIAAPSVERGLLQDVMDTISASLGKDQDQRMAADRRIMQLISEGSGADFVPSIAIYHHPSRKDEREAENFEDFLRLRNSGVALIGLAGAPGHQKDTPNGSYRQIYKTIDRWDPIIEPGAAWDQLLEKGNAVWGAIASSDYHNPNLDHPPCAYSRIHLKAPGRGHQDVLKALARGTFWADHGGLLKDLKLRVEIDGFDETLYPGAELTLDQDDIVFAVSLSIDRGSAFAETTLRTDVISSCPSGVTEVYDSVYLPPGRNEHYVLVPVNQAAGSACHVRAKVFKDSFEDRLPRTATRCCFTSIEACRLGTWR